MASDDSTGHYIRGCVIGLTLPLGISATDAESAQDHDHNDLLDTPPVRIHPYSQSENHGTETCHSTIALSVIRQNYTDRLRSNSHPDQSLASTLVVILMAVELSYTLISCTLTTSKNFTDGFSTGWGMGHIRGAAESYNMSNVNNSSSNARSRARKSVVRPDEHVPSVPRHAKTPSYEFEEDDGAINLRPGRMGGESRAMVLAEQRYWGSGESVSSEGEELGIVRHTEYIVSHDEAPILPKPSMDRI